MEIPQSACHALSLIFVLWMLLSLDCVHIHRYTFHDFLIAQLRCSQTMPSQAWVDNALMATLEVSLYVR